MTNFSSISENEKIDESATTRHRYSHRISMAIASSAKSRILWLLEAHPPKIDNAPRLVTAYPI